MSSIIHEVENFAEFKKHMPPLLLSGREYNVGVDYDTKSNTFKVTSWEEKFDWGWYVDNYTGLYPNYLHCRILDGCQAVAKILEQREVDNEEALGIDDFIHEHGNAMRKPSRYDRD